MMMLNWAEICATHGRGAAALVAVYIRRSRAMSSSEQFTKPPNVLILRRLDKAVELRKDALFVAAREALTGSLDTERYVVYPLGTDDALSTPWKENCTLLIIPSSAHASVGDKADVFSSAVLDELRAFLQSGGALLSVHPGVNAALGYAFPGSFARRGVVSITALGATDIIEDAEVSSVFCFAKTVVTSKDTVEKASARIVLPTREVKVLAVMSSYEPKSSNQEEGVLREEERDEPEEETEKDRIEGVEGEREEEGVPCIQQMKYIDGGTAVLSHIDLLSHPSTNEVNVEELVLLKKDAEKVAKLLQSCLKCAGVACSKKEGRATHTFSYLICSDMLRVKLESALSGVASGDGGTTLKGSEVDIELVTTDVAKEGSPVDPLPEPAADQLVLLTNPSPLQLKSIDFNIDQYMRCLRTAYLGRTLIYTPIIGSTQTLLTGNSPLCTALKRDMGLVCVAGQQTRGKGRSGNAWLSPKGCMMFSTVLDVQPWTHLFKKIPLLQHIVALSVVSAIRTIPGYEALPVYIKWPNDIYYQAKVKLGGILVSCFSIGRSAALTAVVGCGVNVSNRYPTMSVNDCIALYNQEMGGSLPPLTVEQLLALTLNRLEMYLSIAEGTGLHSLIEQYYQYWLHSNKKVKLARRNNEEVTILGISEHGYLEVETQNGEKLSLQPDGNSFDIMKNLISIK